MKIIVAEDYEELSKKVAEIVLRDIASKKDMVLGFATGSTPVGMYKELISACKSGKGDFYEVTTFNLDEYYPIEKKDEQSYSYFMHENLFDSVNLKKENINLLDGLAKDAAVECRRYEELINKRGIDLQILGIGSNGHVGFNEPDTPFNSLTHKVELSQNTIKDNSRFFKSIGEVPKFALSMGLRTIFNAKRIVVLASGKQKAAAVKAMVEGDIGLGCPASLLRYHTDCTLILDREAAGLLKSDELKRMMSLRGFNVVMNSLVPKDKTIMVVSPHPDDSSINIGGTIAKLSSDNEVHVFVMTAGHHAVISGKSSPEERMLVREKESKEDCGLLKCVPHFCRLKFYDDLSMVEEDVKIIEEEIRALKPDIIMLPHKDDDHPTHVASREIVIRALEDSELNGKHVELWNYESVWSLFNTKKFNTIVPLSEIEMERKMEAIKCHKSQLERTMFDSAAKALAVFRGALVPEQALSTYGKVGVKMEKFIELFVVEPFFR